VHEADDGAVLAVMGGGGGGAAWDLGVSEDGAADGEPARAPALADVGPLVEQPGQGRRRRGSAVVVGGGEAAQRMQIPRPPHY